MSGKVDSLAPKRVRRSESPDVFKNQSTAQAADAFTPDWSELPKELIPKIGVFLNKKNVAQLTRVCRAFNTGITTSCEIKRPLTAIRTNFKQEVVALTSGTPILPYMYDHVQELTGHTAAVYSVIQLKDARIVSGSEDNT